MSPFDPHVGSPPERRMPLPYYGSRPAPYPRSMYRTASVGSFERRSYQAEMFPSKRHFTVDDEYDCDTDRFNEFITNKKPCNRNFDQSTRDGITLLLTMNDTLNYTCYNYFFCIFLL